MGFIAWIAFTVHDSSSLGHELVAAPPPLLLDSTGGAPSVVALTGVGDRQSTTPDEPTAVDADIIDGDEAEHAHLVIRVEPPPHMPASGALVVIDRWDGIDQLEPERAIADENGIASISTRSGRLRLSAWGEGYIGSLSTYVLPGENDPILIRCANRESLTGLVVDQMGEPVSGASIWIEVYGSEARTTSDADGRFMLQALPDSGKWQVIHVASPMFGQESALVYVEGGGIIHARQVSMDGALVEGFYGQERPLVITLPPALTVTGRVIDGRGLAIEGARVESHGHYSFGEGMGFLERHKTGVAEDGCFSLGGLRSDITHVLRVKAEGFGAQSFAVQPRSNLHQGLLVTLHPAVKLDVHVRTAEGWPAEGLSVSILAKDSPLSSLDPNSLADGRDMRAPFAVADDGRCDGVGKVSFTGLQPGYYQATVSCLGSRVHVEEVTLYSGSARAELEISLSERVPAVRAVARANDGSPFFGRLHFVGSDADISIAPREGGQVVLAGISLGQIRSFRVFATAGRNGVAGGYLDLESGERLPLEGVATPSGR